MQTAKLIGSGPLVTNYAYSCSFFNLNSIYAQTLRWKRKPIWLPTAKSKVFRVPQKPKIPIDEYKEIQRLYNNYRTYLRSIRYYYIKLAKENEVQFDEEHLTKEEEDDFQKCMSINNKWNEKLAAEREIRLKQESEARALEIMQKVEDKKKRDAAIRLKVDTEIREFKMIAPTFITRENIDQAIEEVLANVVDHNKAIDLNGEWYTEPSGLPIKKKEAKVEKRQ